MRSLAQWFRPDPPSRPPRPGHRPPDPLAEEPMLDLRVSVQELCAGWNTERGRLTVAAAMPITAGDRVLLAVTGVDSQPLPLEGVVAHISRSGGAVKAELDVNEEQRGLVARLLAHVQRGAEAPRARPPRHRAKLPAVITLNQGSVFMVTTSVSRGGCGLVWSGPAPRIGSVVFVRLGSGPRAAAARGMICWFRQEERGARAGVRFVPGQEIDVTRLLGKTAATAP